MAKPRSPRQKKAAEAATEEVPSDLKDTAQALRALATIVRLLEEGHFPYRSRELLEQSFNFLKALHEPMFKKAQLHPKAHLVPGLISKPNVQEESASA